MGKYEITSGKIEKAQKVVIMGVEGIGKTSLAAQFPGVLFIDTEGSTEHYDVPRMPRPTSWEMLLDEIRDVVVGKYCSTLVVDTADWAEHLCAEHICAKNKCDGIEAFGYGKGYTYLAEEFGKMLNLLSDVINVGINVVLCCHTAIKRFEQPNEFGSYDRYEMKLEKKTAPLVKEWADLMLFCNYKTVVIASDSKMEKNKAQGNKRVMYTTHHPCWDAKNRVGLPDEVPLSYDSIAHVIPNINKSNRANTVTKVCEITKDDVEQSVEIMGILDSAIPKSLRDLMEASGVDEKTLCEYVESKGAFPKDVRVSNYPADFVAFLIGNWGNIRQEISQIVKVPF